MSRFYRLLVQKQNGNSPEFSPGNDAKNYCITCIPKSRQNAE